MEKETNRRDTRTQSSASTRDGKGRGRPTKAQEGAELRRVVCSALSAYHGSGRPRNPEADRLLEARQLPLIGVVREAACDDHLTAWQILRLVIESVIDDELELLTAWITVLRDPEMKRRRQEELDFLRGYFCHGTKLAGFKPAFECHTTTVYRRWKQPIFDDLVDRIIDTLSDERIASPNLMEAISRHGNKRAELLHRLR